MFASVDSGSNILFLLSTLLRFHSASKVSGTSRITFLSSAICLIVRSNSLYVFDETSFHRMQVSIKIWGTGVIECLFYRQTYKTVTEDFLLHCRVGKHLSSKTIKAYTTDLQQFTFFLSSTWWPWRNKNL